MGSKPQIEIGGRIYKRVPSVERYQIPLDELGSLRMQDVPACSHLEILPSTTVSFGDVEFYALNNGTDDSPCVYGGVTAGNTRRELDLLQNAYLALAAKFPSITVQIRQETTDNGSHTHLYMSIDCSKAREVLVREAIAPFIFLAQQLAKVRARVFVCHASEDKLTARELSRLLSALEAEIWFDEWEIRVGESIVQKINAALSTMTHLVVLLSRNSVKKPWVQKELSAGLMRQLSDNSVTVLPVRLDDCEIPVILADVRYADGRSGTENAFREIEKSLLGDVCKIS